MNLEPAKYEVSDGNGFRLSDYSTQPENEISKKESKSIIRDNVKELRDFQERMYANQSRSALIVFQAMDAAGKDGTIERLVTGINPQGVEVSAFKAPTALELRHNFLWRIQGKLPPRGIIGVFNRSHYEEVLVVRVHPAYLLPQNIPGIEKAEDAGEELWQRRFEMIRNFEQNLVDTGTTVLKFFLHVSKEEQKDRLLDRIAEPDKHWKFNLGDVEERAYWDGYMNAFEQAIAHTATPTCPWFVIPADDKHTMRALVTEIVRRKLCAVEQPWPETSAKGMEEIKMGEEMLRS